MKHKLPKAAKGLKDIFSGEDGADNTNAAIGAGAGALSTGLALAQGSRTDARGVAKGGSALGVLSSAASGAAAGASLGPIGAAIGGVVGLGTGIFQSVQQDKDRVAALKAQQLNDQQQQWNRVGKDPSVQPGQYKGGAKRLKTEPTQTYNQPGSKEPIGDTIAYDENSQEKWNDDIARRNYSDQRAGGNERANNLVLSGATSQQEFNHKYPNKAAFDARAQQQMQRRGPVGDKNLYAMGSKKVATKAIEIEGGEPHFSKKAGGQRTLKQYHPNGPKHSQGGIPTVAAEGDAIVTAKGAKGAQAVAAHQRGDHATVEKLINQMPADNGKPKASGGKRRTVVAALTPAQLAVKGQQQMLNQNGYNVTPDGKVGPHSQAAMNDFGGMNTPLIPRNLTANQLPALPDQLKPLPLSPTSQLPVAKSGAQNNALRVAQAAPSIYNLGQGLFGNVDKVTRRSYSPEQQQYQDLSGPQREASTQAMNQQVSNARNLSAGSAGNLRSNQNQAYADNVTRQNGIDAQESGRRLTIASQNVESRNQAQLQNNAMNNQSDEIDAQREARKKEYLTTGLQGISGLAGGALVDRNAKARDQQTAGQIGGMLKNYTMVKGANDAYTWEAKKKNGARAIKIAKK